MPWSYLENFAKFDILGASIIDVMIGITFGLLVMLPFQQKFSVLRAFILILSSIIIYITVAQLAVSHYRLFNLDMSYTNGIILSGALGALLTGLSIQFFAPVSLTKPSYPLLLLVGSITGYIFSITIDSSLLWVNAIGFVIWQSAVFATTYFTQKPSG